MNNVSGKSVIGLKVVSVEDGSVVGTVKELIYNPQRQLIEAILLKKPSVFSRQRYILSRDIHSFGEDAVMVPDRSVSMNSKEVGEIINVTASDNYLDRNKILTDEGKALGSVSDILFNSKTAVVDHIEVSQGTFKNIASGKKSVSATDLVTIGKNAVVVKNYTEHKFEEQAKEQAVTGLINDTAEKTAAAKDSVASTSKKLASTTKETTEELTHKVKRNYKEVRDSAKENYSDARAATKENYDQVSDSAKQITEKVKNNLKDKDTTMSTSDKLSGKAKQAAGSATGDENLKNEGKAEELKGKTKDLLGNLADNVSNKIDKANNKLESKKRQQQN